MRYDEIDTQLRALGWVFDRVRGSHRVYQHPAYGACLCVAQHGRTFEPPQWRNLLADLRRMGASEHAAALEARHGAAA